MTEPTRTTFRSAGVYGLGRWGLTLALALEAQGVLDAVASHRPRHPADLPGGLGGRWVDHLDAVTARVDVLFLAVRDDALTDVVTELARRRTDWSGRAVVHSSGAHGRAVLEPLAQRGARVGVLHPLNSFTDPTADVARLAGTYFAINADPDLADWLQARVQAMGGRPLFLDDREQPVYHLVAVLVANAPVALAEMARRLLERRGLADRVPWEAYRPLIRTACQNMQTDRPGARLTGPWIRGDARTVALHRQVLAAAPPVWQEVYRVLHRLVDAWRREAAATAGGDATDAE